MKRGKNFYIPDFNKSHFHIGIYVNSFFDKIMFDETVIRYRFNITFFDMSIDKFIVKNSDMSYGIRINILNLILIFGFVKRL